jgi:hypothetical protein
VGQDSGPYGLQPDPEPVRAGPSPSAFARGLNSESWSTWSESGQRATGAPNFGPPAMSPHAKQGSTCDLSLAQDQVEKRSLLDALPFDSTFDGERLGPACRKPFRRLAEGSVRPVWQPTAARWASERSPQPAVQDGGRLRMLRRACSTSQPWRAASCWGRSLSSRWSFTRLAGEHPRCRSRSGRRAYRHGP